MVVLVINDADDSEASQGKNDHTNLCYSTFKTRPLAMSHNVSKLNQ